MSIAPHERDLPYDPPHPAGNYNLGSYIALNCWAFENPTLLGISNPFWGRGGV